MITIAALYHFTRFEDADALRPAVRALCNAQDVKGTILFANEGVNGTIAGPRAGIDTVVAHLRSLPGCAGLEWKESFAEKQIFGKIKAFKIIH